MSKIKPRGKVPKKASLDEIVEIKTLIRHPMHSGRMKDKDGKKNSKKNNQQIFSKI
jgi:sulfur-oxidizing protein SoxZ